MKIRHENKVMGERILKSMLFMHHFYVKVIGFRHYDFLNNDIGLGALVLVICCVRYLIASAVV